MVKTSQNGVTYLGVLVMTMLFGITLAGASTYWRTIMVREREQELLFRGDQIKMAIQSYYQDVPRGRRSTYPRRLKDLLRDPRYPGVRRHLRKLYTDPMTPHGQWGVITDGRGSIKGVHSQSDATPLKTDNFPKGYEHFGKSGDADQKTGASTAFGYVKKDNSAIHRSYADWKFIYTPEQKTSEQN